MLEGFARDHEIVAEARGSGLMLGIETANGVTGEPNSEAASAVQRGAIERGLIVELDGRGDYVVRLAPPRDDGRPRRHEAV